MDGAYTLRYTLVNKKELLTEFFFVYNRRITQESKLLQSRKNNESKKNTDSSGRERKMAGGKKRKRRIWKIIAVILGILVLAGIIWYAVQSVQTGERLREGQQSYQQAELTSEEYAQSTDGQAQNRTAGAEQAETTQAGAEQTETAQVDSSVVFFTSDISPEGLREVYDALAWTPEGKVAVKLSTGEPPASNYLEPELIKELVQSVDGTIVENNTAYGGSRAETAMHMQVAEDHGFTDIADVDILDADGSLEIPVEGGSRLTSNLVGSHFSDYDSYLVLSHFKGHAMAGFGGAIKNISIGMASREGKCLIHTSGRSHTSPWGGNQIGFTESMAEAAKSVSDYLGGGERIVYINVLNNISIDCDCDGNPAEPDIHDIGIVASHDPAAVDQACIDLAFAAEGSESLQNRVAARDGLHTLEHAEEIGLGNRAYQLVNLD